MNIPDYVCDVINILYTNGYECYLVGGCVRDFLMGKTPSDFDLTTNALPQEMLLCFEGMKIIETGIKHGTVTVVSKGENVEITTYRIDGEYKDNRHPDAVYFTKKINEDLSRRDFTINAIAYSPYDGLVDPYNGKCDIKSKTIKCVGNPDKRFKEDGLRILRALRFSSVLGFEIDDITKKSIHKNAFLLENISSERIFSEFKKILSGKNCVRVLMQYADVFGIVFPPVKNNEEKYLHNIFYVGLLKNDIVLRFSALFSEFSINDIKDILKSLKCDNNFYKDVFSVCENVSSDIKSDKISVRYLMKKTNKDNLLRTAELKKILSENFNYDEFIMQLKKQYLENSCVCISQLDISGNDIINLGIHGKMIGSALEKLLDAVICDKCENTHESLIRYTKSNILNQ